MLSEMAQGLVNSSLHTPSMPGDTSLQGAPHAGRLDEAKFGRTAEQFQRTSEQIERMPEQFQ